MANPLLTLAKRVQTLEKRVRTLGSTSQLAYSSLEDGSIDAFTRDGSQVMTIGRQWDGTYIASSQNGPTPPTPTQPVVSEGIESLTIGWNGLFENAAVAPMDFLRVDIHIGSTADFIPSHSNRKGSIIATTGGVVTVGLPAPFTYFVKLVCWSQAGVVSQASDVVEADTWTAVAGSDGFAPVASPDPTVLQGIESMVVRWLPITNADPVTYQVHISTTLGFAPDASTLVGTTTGSQFVIRALPGDEPAPGEEDLRTLLYDVTYYVRIVAVDADGEAPYSLQGLGSIFRVTGINLAADSITAANIASGTLTGELFAGVVFLGGTFKTAEAGQRIEFGVAGIQGYKADGTVMIDFPTDGTQEAKFDGEFTARGLTVIGGATFYSGENEIATAAALNLSAGVTDPVVAPTLAVDYETIRFDTNTVRTGELGSFALNASQVKFIKHNVSSNTIYVYQHHSGPDGKMGTRVWYFAIAKPGTNPSTGIAYVDGDPVAPYFLDLPQHEVLGEAWLAGDTRYRLSRFAGAGYWVYKTLPSGYNHYKEFVPGNPSKTPMLGDDGTNWFIGEVDSAFRFNVGFRNWGATDADPITLSSLMRTDAVSTFGSASVNTVAVGAGDFPGVRYIMGLSDTPFNVRSYLPNSGAGTLTLQDEGWEWPSGTQHGLCWVSGRNAYYGYSSDGFLYRFTGYSSYWNSTQSSKIWAATTLADTNAGGTGTHETKLGPLRWITAKRRSRVRVNVPEIVTAGGVDDVNAWKLYMVRQDATPDRTLMGLQTTGTTSSPVYITTIASTAAGVAPSSSNFPNATPAKVRNQTESLLIDATGLIRGVEFWQGSDPLAIQGPYMYAHLNANTPSTLATSTWTAIANWTIDDPTTGNQIPQTGATGTFTVPRAGRYLITLFISYADNATGDRGAAIYINGVSRGNTLTRATSAFQGVAQISLAYRLTAGGTIQLRGWQNAGALAIRGDAAGSYTNVQISYVGP